MDQISAFDINAFEDIFRQHDDPLIAPCPDYLNTTGSSKTFWAHQLSEALLMSGSPPASRTSTATHCVCKGMHLPHNNTLQSFGISDLMLQSTSPSFSFSPGFSFEPSIELGQEAMLQRPTNPDSLQTVCEPWNFDMSTTAVQDDTLTYTDYLEHAQVDAIGIAGVHTPDSAIVGVIDPLGQDAPDKEMFGFEDHATNAQDVPQTPTSLLDRDDWLPEDLQHIGIQDASGNWRCGHGGCANDKTFMRACDLRKHYRSHLKFFFCNSPSCSSALTGFSTRKDLQRHMRSHNPDIICPEPGCGRRFGRADNMRSHHVKMHQSAKNSIFPRTCRRSSAKKR